MAVDLGSYRWLAESALGEAGCVTVVPGAAVGPVASAFGCVPESETQRPGDDEVHLASSDAATTAFEDNGFQGSRPEVLRPLSRLSENGKAASLFWNVNGMVVLALAQRGKLVCEVELLEPDEAELEGMPRRLQRLLLTLPGDDLLALGAVLVETFTGVGFGPADLEAATPRPLEPVPADRITYTAETSPLLSRDPELSAAIVSLAPGVQRALAETVTLAAVREAGLADDPALAVTTRGFGSGDVADLAPATASRLRALDQQSRRAWAEQHETDDEGIAGTRLRVMFAAQGAWVARAVRAATHPDALSAALESVSAARSVFGCSHTERAVAFRDDDRGRHQVNPTTDTSRAPDLDRVVAAMVAGDPATWPDILATLPRPFTAAEREGHAARDLEREESGAFQTWQFGAPQEPPQTIFLSRPSQ